MKTLFLLFFPLLISSDTAMHDVLCALCCVALEGNSHYVSIPLWIRALSDVTECEMGVTPALCLHRHREKRLFYTLQKVSGPSGEQGSAVIADAFVSYKKQVQITLNEAGQR